MLRKKKKQNNLTYEEEHNKYYRRYKKMSRVFIYAGAFNVVGLVISLLQATKNNIAMFFYFCFGINDFIFRLMYMNPWFQGSGFWLYIVLIFIIAIATSSIAILSSVFASQGKKKWLVGSIIAYIIDAFMAIPCYLFVGEEYYSALLLVVFHIIVLSFMIMALYYYQKIVDLAINKGVIKKKGEVK